MKNTTLTATAALVAALALPGSAGAQTNSETVSFSWQGENFDVSVPNGYCLPTAEQQRTSDNIAAGDSQNETMIEFQRCGSYGSDYILIKTPRALPPVNLPREQFVALVAEQIGGAASEEGKRIGARDVEEMSNGRVSVDGQNYDYAGYDDYCAYMAGTIDLTSPDSALQVRAGSCLTLVGKRNFAVHVYDNRPGGASVATLKQRSFEVASTIAQK